MIRLIAVDLDGTLLAPDKSLSDQNRLALHQANALGIKIVICTGRPYLAAQPVLDQLGLKSAEDYLITFNGGQIHRASDGQVIYRQALDYSDFLIWQKELERLQLPWHPVDEEWVYQAPNEDSPVPSIYVSQVTTAPAKTKDYLLFGPDNYFLKFVVATNQEYLLQQLEQLDPELADQYAIVHSHPFQIEISKAGVSKGNALARLGRRLQIPPEEMLTIGDQANDASMIQMAGIGVAMGNAADEVKAQADYVTASNQDNGVAEAIYHLLNIRRGNHGII
ncbi:Cof-type HAD-IIB family hydrolase [Ignavigranum ruoffiae]|uniref:Cof-type HAD-IIB family hydrolase n=1 Tax=Ignavigranum ruoffiae TaxID=89093 RepID=UPI0024ACE40F|nr:Cof-type HAD-IIB family hydrolase [Ignavigranum ruoffiae]